MAQRKSKEYWFPRRANGRGWGAPTTWQGWLALDTFLLVLLWDSLNFLTSAPKGVGGHIHAVVSFVVILAADLLGLWYICSQKGAPAPRSRR